MSHIQIKCYSSKTEKRKNVVYLYHKTFLVKFSAIAVTNLRNISASTLILCAGGFLPYNFPLLSSITKGNLKITRVPGYQGGNLTLRGPHLTPMLAAQLTAPPWANYKENISNLRERGID